MGLSESEAASAVGNGWGWAQGGVTRVEVGLTEGRRSNFEQSNSRVPSTPKKKKKKKIVTIEMIDGTPGARACNKIKVRKRIKFAREREVGKRVLGKGWGEELPLPQSCGVLYVFVESHNIYFKHFFLGE